MDYFITGSTGLVGSHVLFELLQKIHAEELNSKIYLLVRKSKSENSVDRIRKVLFNDEAPNFVKNLPLEELLKRVVCIESDLNNPELGAMLEDLNIKELKVVHIAASTNLMQGPKAEQDIYENNYKGTLNLVDSLKSVNVSRFSFISTAYSCGIQDELDVIENNYLDYSNNGYRNPYEGHKNKIERILSKDCAKRGIDLQILRPAVVSGRLIDAPLYKTTKFDVFYGWAKFFYGRKEKIGDSNFRVAINKLGTLNVVPVDYVAKVITKAIHMSDIKQLNIVNQAAPSHVDFWGRILEEIGIPNFEFTETVPDDMSVWETLYYKSVGRVFNPYLCGKNLLFDARILKEKFVELQFNDVLQNTGEMIQFAISKKFSEIPPVVTEPKKGEVIKLASAEEEQQIRNLA